MDDPFSTYLEAIIDSYAASAGDELVVSLAERAPTVGHIVLAFE